MSAAAAACQYSGGPASKMQTLCRETVNWGLLLLDSVSWSVINLFRATDPLVRMAFLSFFISHSHKLDPAGLRSGSSCRRSDDS